jgi:hypothetical protein
MRSVWVCGYSVSALVAIAETDQRIDTVLPLERPGISRMHTWGTVT